MHSDAAIAKLKSSGTSYTGAFDAARNASLESAPQTVVQFSVAGTATYRYAAVPTSWFNALQLGNDIVSVRSFANGEAH
jgi:type II secretory pathway component HofQ